MVSNVLAEKIGYGHSQGTSGDKKVSPPESSNLSDQDLAKIEALFKKHVEASEKAMESMTEAAASMQGTVSKAISAAAKAKPNWIAAAGIPVGILSIVVPLSYLAFDSRLTIYEETQEKRLASFEGAIRTVAANLESLRLENVQQLKAFSDKFDDISGRIDGVNGRVDGVQGIMLRNSGSPVTNGVDDSFDAASSPTEN